MNFNVFLHRLLYKLGYSYRYNKLMPVYKAEFKATYNGNSILSDSKANKLICENILSGNPFLVSRLGSVELSILYNYLLYNKKDVRWDQQLIYQLKNNAGFFPVTNANLSAFAEKYLDCLGLVDIMGVWFNEGEEYVCKSYCPDVSYVNLKSIEPYYHLDPWSQALEGQKVLVIHPFENSIKHQYQHFREMLFDNKKVLPKFELITLKAVQSIADTNSGFGSWFEALDHMCTEIERCSFDVAIIGAGAYGLPLGAHIKKLGKQAVHMGGATQIFFGIKGSRWENNKEIAQLFNQYWKRPYSEEVPQQAKNVENGCYW